MLTLAASQNLLMRARMIYDNPDLPFAEVAAQEGWRSGFTSGADWMRITLSHVRGSEVPPHALPLQRMGLVKYGLCSIAALAYLALVLSLRWYPLIIGVVFVFYAVEAQMVFLFPLALDGVPDYFRASRRWTQKAGGTLQVVATVLPLAVVMLFGGFIGQGFIRSWFLGCLAVVLWYEDLRRTDA